MAIIENLTYMPLNFPNDPDDYRPNSAVALVVDPARTTGGFVKGLTVFCERIAAGDRIPPSGFTEIVSNDFPVIHTRPCVAVDGGPDVVNRKAARSCERNASERNAIVIDRFFDTKQRALAWAKARSRFITVRIVTPGTEQGTKLVATTNPRSSPGNIASSVKTSWPERPE